MSRTSNTLPAPSDELLAVLRAATASVQARATDRLASAHDASHYLLTPQAVVAPTGIEEVAAVLAATRRLGVPVTFRSGGTSLSGQAGTNGVLVDTRRNFRRVEVVDGGNCVRCGPGATVRAVNNRLLRYGRKLGPDPASEIACTVGGVVANNSSGMCCGVTANTYHTLDSAVLVLPTGTIVDTSRDEADDLLRLAEPDLHARLIQLRDRVRGNDESVATIRSLFAIKNTMGYAVNAFLDYDRPVEILEHLVVGSEGTLAFVAEATFRTVTIKPHCATGLLIFPDLASATSALPRLVASGFAAIELMDATSLRVAQRDPKATDDLLALSVAQHAALLVEYQQETEDELELRIAHSQEVLRGLPLVTPGVLSTDPVHRSQLWHIRKGLFAIVAGNRPSGTTALLEDIAVPVEHLYATCSQLIALFATHGYENSVIFGHAKDGNIHFMLNERFDDPTSLRRYESFTEEMVELVLGQGGTLKAEHGTGRMMAPFVRRQYGDELYDVMREIKHLLDPAGLLNPGVIINDDPQAYVRNLKVAPTVDREVDRCVECGYCEPLCPSRDLTLTPRERIALRREMVVADRNGDKALAATLRKEYRYDGMDTCAVDGMCEMACPVLINTGDLVRRLRTENAGTVQKLGWKAAADHWAAVARIGGLALTIADNIPASLPAAATTVARAMFGTDTIPAYTDDLPAGGKPRPRVTSAAPAAVFFASCTTTLFGPVDGGTGVAESFLSLCERAEIGLITPDDLRSLCCGTPWKSKGLTQGYSSMKARVADSLMLATRGGQLPVVCDAASCTEGLHVLLESAEERGLTVVDAVSFVNEHVLARLPDARKVPSLTLHPTCSSTRMGINAALMRVAAAVAEDLVVPDDWGCCAFAGDRGMLYPELTASATGPQAQEAVQRAARAHASLNRTCELGMTRATGQPYRHILELLDEATREPTS